MSKPFVLVLASQNKAKAAEMRRLLGGEFSVITLGGAGVTGSPEETGAAFAENAYIKALAAVKATGLACLADDSGLCVDALGGAPGVYSARYGDLGSDAERNGHLLRQMEGEEARSARFACAAVCLLPDAQTGKMRRLDAYGECEGEILLSPRGEGGFGYDPLFLIPSLGRSMAELDPEEKNALSHRGIAMREIAGKIKRALVKPRRIALYGGSFDPPHLGHAAAAETALAALNPDVLYVMPALAPPHKPGAALCAPRHRLEMCRLAFSGLPGAQVCGFEFSDGATGFTVDTVGWLKKGAPEAEIWLIVGQDMLFTLDIWKNAETLLRECRVAALCRADGQSPGMEDAARSLRKRFGADVTLLPHSPVEISSSRLREALPLGGGGEYLDSRVLGYVMKHGLYGASTECAYLRALAQSVLDKERWLHTLGVEQTAYTLALRWGADSGHARAAALMHDITKTGQNQLKLCEKYGILLSGFEREHPKLLHAMTAAAFAKTVGMPRDIYDAVRWHTTGRAGMGLLEKIVFLADYTEPFREEMAGLETLRKLAYTDLDGAMLSALTMKIDHVRARGSTPHPSQLQAWEYFGAC